MSSKERNFFKKLKKRKAKEKDVKKHTSIAAFSEIRSHVPNEMSVVGTNVSLPIQNGDLFAAFAKLAPMLVEAAESDHDYERESNDLEEQRNSEPLDSSTDEEFDFASDKDEDENPMRTGKSKHRQRLSIADLKKIAPRPDLVDWVDITSPDPALLVQLKAVRRTVPVPIHWQQKRKFLQNKRGIEKAPYVLPQFIEATGIAEVRQSILDKDVEKSLRQKGRDRMRARMGKMDIDYQKLHDAFFNWQNKPYLSRHGDIYYEGKENEKKFPDKKPGFLSAELKQALGMEDGTAVPPPWLFAMQRLGPPPSYLALRIPGVNAPIPPGAQWGFHQGGWGNPPVDMYGRPLYGDVLGLESNANSEFSGFGELLWGEPTIENEELPQSEVDDAESESDEVSGADTQENAARIEPSSIGSFTLEKDVGDSEESDQALADANLALVDNGDLRDGIASSIETSRIGASNSHTSRARNFKF